MPAPIGLVEAIPGFLKDPKYSDLIVKCHEEEWRVHKAFVCPQSSFFATACAGDSIVSHSTSSASNVSELGQEAKNGIIDLPDEKPLAVASMLEFIYTGIYDENAGVEQAVPRMVLDVYVYTIADKFGMQPLAQMAAQKFCEAAPDDWDDRGFAAAIRELYENAPDKERSMRDAVLASSISHADELLQCAYGAEFRKVVTEVRVFGIEFRSAVLSIQELRLRLGGKRLYVCSKGRDGDNALMLQTLTGSNLVQCPKCGRPWDWHMRVSRVEEV